MPLINGVEQGFYPLYGRIIHSEYPLPLQTVRESRADISVHYEGLIPKTREAATVTSAREWKRAENGDYLLEYYNAEGHVVQFRLNEDGSRIQLAHSWHEWRDTLFVLMNPVMAAALYLQGAPLLHAASLVYEDTSFLISGESGAGKSTLSAALAMEGMALHSDDISVIDLAKEQYKVEAGYPRIKMKQDVAQKLGIPAEEMLPIVSIETEDAERWVASEQFPAGFYGGPARPGAVFLLSHRSPEAREPAVSKLAPGAAAVALATHRYGRDWLEYPETGILQFCSALAAAIPVYQVHMPDDSNLLQVSARKLMDTCIVPLSSRTA